MALGKIVVTSLVLLTFILSTVTAFISPLSSVTGRRAATASARTHTSGVYEVLWLPTLFPIGRGKHLKMKPQYRMLKRSALPS